MLARLEGVARHTRDVDLLSRTGGLSDAEQALQVAVALDLDDYFSFTLSPGRQIVQGAGAMRVDVVAFLGIREFAKFHVDLVIDRSMTMTPDSVPPLVTVDLPGLPSTNYRAYPVADHVADKVCGAARTARARQRVEGGEHALSRPGRPRCVRSHCNYRRHRTDDRAFLRGGAPRSRPAQPHRDTYGARLAKGLRGSRTRCSPHAGARPFERARNRQPLH